MKRNLVEFAAALVLTIAPAWASACSPDGGAANVGTSATAVADGSGGGRDNARKLNGYAVKSYSLMRQTLTSLKVSRAPGNTTLAAANEVSRRKSPPGPC